MGRVFGWIAIAFTAVAGAALGVGVAARQADGPIGPFPGGPLVSGELVDAGDVDWTFAGELREIELETDPAAPLSRTTWVAVVDGDLYVGCGLPRWKRWPEVVRRDPRVVLRVAGRRYERQAVREADPERLRLLGAEFQRKYGAGDAESAVRGEDVWFYRMDPRTPS